MLSWSTFEALAGSPQHNFEVLWRSGVRLRYAQYGLLAGLANQPGVEFHLHLHSACDLGKAGDWFGWQCRWYDLPNGRNIGAARQLKIEDSIKKSSAALPGLTHWILCTRHALTKGDQTWFFGLKKKLGLKFALSLQNSLDVESLLTGDAEILRKTFFGELVFSSAYLKAQHETSVSPIKKRWFPEVHQSVDAEREIRRMLGEASSWNELLVVGERLLAAAKTISRLPFSSKPALASQTKSFLTAASAHAKALNETHSLLKIGDFELLRHFLKNREKVLHRDILVVPMRLRSANMASGLYATNAADDMRQGLELFNKIENSIGVRLVGVLADAGAGKTQLSAQITAALVDRPAGVLLHGRDLQNGKTLDDIVKSVKVHGVPVPSIEALLAALDAAGQRAKRRIPLVIDGLNEAEDPRMWKGFLSAAQVHLTQHANVLLVCTVRTGARRISERDLFQNQIPEETEARSNFAEEALPDNTTQIELPGLGSNTSEAITKYFNYFLIDVGDAELPYELLSHPLTLRIFCEVTNPERKKEVSVEAMPGSLTGLFAPYLESAISRIADLASLRHRFYPHDVRKALNYIGRALWDGKTRELKERDLRQAIGDESRSWDSSLVRMLEQEGVILLMPGGGSGERLVIAVYDLLGGFLIADALLARYGSDEFKEWLKTPETLTALNSRGAGCHPLAFDVFRSFVGLVPRRFHGHQLWQVLDEPLQSTALRIAATNEANLLDETTISALAEHIRQSKPNSDRLFRRLYQTRGATNHPLNATFFDSVLRHMSVAERDLQWTEWVRRNYMDHFSRERVLDVAADVHSLESRWKKNVAKRTASDRLRAKWLSWFLTTTARNLRDRVTRALYWFGRGDPIALFELTEGASEINDPYVFERLLAASYGVAMAAHCTKSIPDFRKKMLPVQAKRFFDLMFKSNAPGRTTHLLTREYGLRFIELALFHNPKLFTKAERALLRSPFSDGGRIAWRELDNEEPNRRRGESPLGMDFENYSLGRLADGRGNYNFEHEGYRKIRAKTLWRISDLGWTNEKFANVESKIESHRQHYSRTDEELHKVDRYGKKYSWIAYFELNGWLQDNGLLHERDDFGRTWDVDIDPSFVERAAELKIITTNFLGKDKLPLGKWIKSGPAPDLKPFIEQASVNGNVGPWVMLDGYFSQEDPHRGRRIFGFLRSFLVSRSESKAFEKHLAKHPFGERWLPEKPNLVYTFAGENPWCSTFPVNETAKMNFQVASKMVKVKRKQIICYLDSKRITLSSMDLVRLRVFGSAPDSSFEPISLPQEDLERVECRSRIIDVKEERPVFNTFRALVPVVDFHWEGKTIEGVSASGVSLNKKLSLKANLSSLPQTRDLQTENGVRATYGTAFQKQNFREGESFFFIRATILKEMLAKEKCALVFALWGERELSTNLYRSSSLIDDSIEPRHATYQDVYSWPLLKRRAKNK